jgi:hypothetical protein
MVVVQAEIMAERSRGLKKDFKGSSKAEKEIVRKGLDTVHIPCGVRVMWPNAFALKALLELGYEEDERVKRALRFLSAGGWCENPYRFGCSDLEKRRIPTQEEIRKKTNQIVTAYKYGGIGDLEEFHHLDMTNQCPVFRYPRISALKKGMTTVYSLRMPMAQLPCALMTCWALSKLEDPHLQSLMEMRIWDAATNQNFVDGHFDYKHIGKYFYLDLFSSFALPIAKLAIMRCIPWIIDSQNDDGSWGTNEEMDTATLSVVRAIRSVEALLPKKLRIA